MTEQASQTIRPLTADDRRAPTSDIEIAAYNFAQAAIRLNVTESWLRHAAAAREVPFTKLGRKTLFTEEHIAAILAAGEVPVESAPPRVHVAQRRSAAGRKSA